MNQQEHKSPFAIDKFLDNNDPLAPADLARVYEGIHDLKAQISYVEDKISLWTSQLRALEGRLDQHRGVVSALRGMPYEVLGHIFTSFSFARSSPLPTMGKSARKELVQLTLVCRAWRETALATRRLWAAASVDGDDLADMSYEKAAAWLRRAGGVPRALHVTLYRGEDCPDRCLLPDTSNNHCVLNQSAPLIRLISEGPPLDTLDLKIQHRRCLDRFTGTLADATHRHGRQIPLQTLRLAILTADRPPDFNFLPSFSSLTGIGVMGAQSFGALEKVGGVLERLATLKFVLGDSGESPHVTFQALAKCVNLTELEVAVVTIPHNRFKGVVTLPNVTRLRVQVLLPSASNRSPLESILDHLDLPALISFENQSSYDSSTSCAPFFERHPRIRSFIGRQMLGLAQMHALLTKLPFLTRLTLFGASTIAKYFEASKSPSPADQGQLTRLKWLELWEVDMGLDLRPLLAALHSRRRGGLDSLRGITIEYMIAKRKDPPPQFTRSRTHLHADIVELLRMDGVKVSENCYCTRDSQHS
ncbi:hypothetical protein FA13DRAFT_727709 [Coprinellus micaceus]|uniref:Uncharacterized protein n=1 Tax=Coprinellus micaceus TaxID=71717 RepID=A0A4Y7TVG1_COPMI|nr:hypothetical protein FA13DRAFT_727709 [Coprinellus micaceus]